MPAWTPRGTGEEQGNLSASEALAKLVSHIDFCGDHCARAEPSAVQVTLSERFFRIDA